MKAQAMKAMKAMKPIKIMKATKVVKEKAMAMNNMNAMMAVSGGKLGHWPPPPGKGSRWFPYAYLYKKE